MSIYCVYGCGLLAEYQNKSGKYTCKRYSTQCEVNRKKNSSGGKKSYQDQSRKTGWYDSLPQETKDRMAWSRGLTKDVCPSIAKQQEKLAIYYSNLPLNHPNKLPRGVALDPKLRWKRNHIGYIDCDGKWFNLESIHEWKIANLLDKNNIFWTRPNPIKLSDGTRYEPDFYLRDFDVYLDPKTLWCKKSINKKTKKIVEYQNKQLLKIQKCRNEYKIKIIILYSDNPKSFIWDGILEQIRAHGEIGETQGT